MNTTENNKIIAEFMELPSINDEGQINYIKDLEHCPDYELSYHEDWNWLMEVINKCFENQLFGSNNLISAITLSFTTVFDIDVTYSACVEFIKWYNKTKTN